MPTALAPPAPKKLPLQNNENLSLSHQRQRSRSPHPYHRSKADAHSAAQANGRNITPRFSSGHTAVGYKVTAFFDADRRKRRKISTSPSDSGTEADDESSGLLRGLPAPPARPRKGLKDTRLEGAEHITSPLLTPSFLDEGRQNGSVQYPQNRQESSRNQPRTDDEVQRFRLKFARRRRAEILRRVVEAALLGLLGIVVFSNDKVNMVARQWGREILSHLLTVGALLVVYPLRLFFRMRSRTTTDTRTYRDRFWMPAAFDPAPILYPVLLPVFIALSLIPVGQHILIPNLVLSISSTPFQLIPLLDRVPGYGSGHWMLSLIPLLVSENPGVHGTPERLPRIRLGEANMRLLICGYCLGIIAAGLAIVFRLSAVVEVDTRRKVFHGMMVAMFLPVTFIDPTFAALALCLTLSIFLLLDLFRASQLPPLSKPLTYFLAPYVDGRDHRGPVIVSHMFLLIGCAIPLWLSLARTERCGTTPWEGWEVKTRDLSMVSGVICVGMGDAAASLVGRRYGRRRWIWSGGKSLEGSLAFAIAVIVGLLLARVWLRVGGWDGDSEDAWALTCGKAALAAAGSSLTEAVLTGGNDNVVVPVILWLLVRGLEM
ncbi:phosphatidate cytidylyltransferase [Lasallia pustulata]|uniref:dolichol kinase n=1 Tax=Lasallia pustulata TaxID=136370 RepID=A0A1W5CZ91_9LECA|nr:phosphatidate cytidylyltransferase [Lasallia pustulata]